MFVSLVLGLIESGFLRTDNLLQVVETRAFQVQSACTHCRKCLYTFNICKLFGPTHMMSLYRKHLMISLSYTITNTYRNICDYLLAYVHIPLTYIYLYIHPCMRRFH